MVALPKTTSLNHVILGFIFIIFLIMGYPVPKTLATFIDTLFGKTIVIVLALILFVSVNPILGVLGILVAFDLIRRSGIATGTTAMKKFLPSELGKSSDMTAFNQFPYTLEQEMVKIRTVNKDPKINSPASYQPILVTDDNAASV